MIIKTMLSAVIDTLCLSVIHLRINLFKEISNEKMCNPKWPPFSASIGKRAVTAFWLIFIYSTNFEINILQQVFILQNEFLINNYIILSNSYSINLSWSAFHAHHERGTSESNLAISPSPLLFEEQAASPVMSRHSIGVISKAVQYLNPGQTPIMACDHPLFAITKEIQWISPNSYREDFYVIMLAGSI